MVYPYSADLVIMMTVRIISRTVTFAPAAAAAYNSPFDYFIFTPHEPMTGDDKCLCMHAEHINFSAVLLSLPSSKESQQHSNTSVSIAIIMIAACCETVVI